MDHSILVNFISNVGFPIVAFLMVFWKFDKSLVLLTKAVNNNTQAVQLLLQKEQREGGAHKN